MGVTPRNTLRLHGGLSQCNEVKLAVAVNCSTMFVGTLKHPAHYRYRVLAPADVIWMCLIIG